MSLQKRILFYILVGALLLLLIFGFVKIFNFEAKTDHPSEMAITEVTRLFEYIPRYNDSGVHTQYTDAYITSQSINVETILNMIYNYILANEPDKVALGSVAELQDLGIQDASEHTKVSKISAQTFIAAYPKVVHKERDIGLIDFQIDYQTNAKLINDTYYIYQTNKNKERDYVVFNEITSYTTTNDKVIIYAYYLKCNIKTKMCYNDDAGSLFNNNFTYGETEISSNIDSLKIYEHTYQYVDGNYVWVSTSRK